VNFKNHLILKNNFSKGKNLIFGDNGTGKTSILESIFLLGFGKSFLNFKKDSLVHYDKDSFIIKAEVESLKGINTLISSYEQTSRIFLNGDKIKLSNVTDYFYPLLFTSADFNRYIEKKKYKRKMINRFIFAFETLYLNNLLDYNKTVKKKNILLKKNADPIEIYSWNRILSDLCYKVVNYRINFVRELNLYLKRFNKKLHIHYIPSLDISKGISINIFLNQMQDKINIEKKYSRSLLGVHLDDYKIELDNKDLNYSSTGEKKVNLLLLFIAMIYLYKDKRGEFPVFLLDDFDNSIDTNGLDYLLSIIPKMQIIASSVSNNSLFENTIQLGVKH
jgi:DNA replication and repair protein RecF